MTFASDISLHDDPDQALLIALRAFLSKNPCAARFGPEALSELLYKERYLLHSVPGYEVGAAIEALRVEGEVLA